MASSARVKATNKPTLKSQGAGYSTTNRKGETTYYKSAKDAPGYNDTFQGKGTTSKGNTPISKVNAVGTPVVKAPDVGSVAPANLPSQPTPVDPGALNLDGALGQSIVAGQYQALPPAETDTLDASNQRQQNNFLTATQQLLGIGANDSGMADYQKMEKQAGIKRMQEEVNQYSGTLNSIVANRDAAMLSLEDQGRGQTSGFIGGEQGRINREAAIAALPVQAQLASAQGNLEVAQARLDKLFTIHQQDVKAQYDFKVGVVNSLYQFMDKQETNRANQLIAKEGQKYQEKQNNINYLRSLSSMAIQTGQQGLISKLGAIDPNSPTFEQDVAAIQSQMRLPTSTTPIKRDTAFDKDGNLVDMQTGEIIKAIDGSDTNQLQQATEIASINKVDALKTDKGMSRAVGSYAISRWTPLTADKAEYQNFIASVDQLTKGLTLDELATAKERGITFGALSEGELNLIADSATKINNWRKTNDDGETTHYATSEKNFKKELDTIVNFKKLDAYLKGVPPEQIGIQIMEDGTAWVQNSDGTLTQLQ